ncbi:anti-sigma factor [Arthrobacter sp. AFG7.2]|uniref:anti-sigma factor n=1 Tax=Arthrobacter sp. AFG7.2 TaxID=1688693 RepID=UPI000C9E5FE4|nr:anti-sigma factor [Arthrobacter sp. AFG7.2]PNI10196.1 anti-sigma factor [Arthrobacter sp. AFG7.2]
MRRERQYLERLRDAPIPPASDDLTARLLARTQELAEVQAGGAARPAAPRNPVRVLALAAGGSTAAAAVLAVGAFAAAGEPPAGEVAGSPAAFSQVSSKTPADGRSLDAGQLARLRSEGWACPELEAMGFRLESAKAVMQDGRPAVELRLTDGTHYATVTEQRLAFPGGGGNSDAGQAAPGAGESGPAGGTLRVLQSSPWSATYRTPGHSFAYESDLPAERADDAVPILQHLGTRADEGIAAGLAPSPPAEGEALMSRLQRGAHRIVAFFTPQDEQLSRPPG